MFLKNAISVLFTVALAASVTANPSMDEVDKNPTRVDQHQSDAPAGEIKFAQKAASAGLAEIKMGELAQQKSDNEEVRRFAIEVANDYENAYEKLLIAASEMGINTTSKISAEQKRQYDELAKLSGSEFDQAYISAKVKGYTEIVQLYRVEARKGDATELQLFAAYIVPKLEQHLAAAQDIDESLKDPDSSANANRY